MSTINFDHKAKKFNLAIDISDEHYSEMSASLATIMVHLVKDQPSKSEIAEILAKTFSYKELLYLATEGIEARTTQALEMFADEIKETKEGKESFLSGLLDKPSKDKSDIKSLLIDPFDIEGSLDKYPEIPDFIKEELKARIKKELKGKFKDDENDQ